MCLAIILLLSAIPTYDTCNFAEDDAASQALSRGKEAWKKGDFEEAISQFTACIRLDPKNTDALFSRGMVYMNRPGEYEKAVADFSDVIRLDSKCVKAFLARGMVHARMRKHEKAVTDVSEIIRLDPMHAGAFQNRGDANYDRGSYSLAIADYKEVIRLKPKSPWGYYGLAFVMATCPEAKHRDGSEAIKYAMEACKLTSWKERLCLSILAAAKAEAGQFEEAVMWQQKAIELLSGESIPEIRENEERRLESYRLQKPIRLRSTLER